MSNKPLETVFLKEQSKAFLELKLEETHYWISRYANHLASTVEILEPLAYSKEVSSLLSKETLNRYRGVAYSLSFPYKNYKREEGEGDNKNLMAWEQGFLVQSWSNLGSLLESTLQLFLSFYYRDYINSTHWNVWNETTVSQLEGALKGKFSDILKDIVKDNQEKEIEGVTSKIRKSFEKKVKKIITDKSVMPAIETITLSDLIQFYFGENVINEQQYSKKSVETINWYRNSIHSFKDRPIGTWSELNEFSKIVLMLIIGILNRLPDIPDEIPVEYNYSVENRELLQQENKWFDYIV